MRTFFLGYASETTLSVVLMLHHQNKKPPFGVAFNLHQGFCLLGNIPRLAAYEQARRALRGVCEPRAFGAVVRTLYSTVKENKNRPSDDGLFLFAKEQ